LAQQYPEDSRHFGVAVRSFSEATLPAGQRAIFLRAAVLLSVLALVVLVVTCANLTNLFLTRAEGRRGELAIRQSLGASRGTLIRQMLAESLLLAVAGGVLGLALSVAGTRFLWSLRPPTLENGSLALGIDGRGLLFALALSILAALWFGLIPAIRAARGEVTAGLRGGAEEVRGSARGFALRDALLVFQIGLCLVALVVSGLFLRSLRSIQETPAGFVPGDVVLMSFDASSVGLDTDGGRVLFRRVLETARRQPGVRRAALAQSRPLVAPLVQRRILPSDQPDESGSALQVLSNTVSDGYFSTLEIPLLQGREFSELDNLERPRVAILNATLAERLWPDRPALGRSLRFEGGEESLEVVGIVGDIKYNTLTEGAQPYLYFPVGQDYYPATTLHAKTTVKPSDLARAIQEVEPKLALTGVMTAGEQVASSLRAPRLASFLLGLFAVVTLLLAVLGTYALAAHSVRRRRPEIGLRIALGARRQALLLTLTRRTLVLTGIGLVLGLLAAYLFVPTAASLLHGLGALDPASFGAASIILALTAVAATLVPAYRALRCDPATILKGSR
ncbi:MAG: FtsX-like permease family protein, partial [Acidobacteriota bacterium]